MIPNVLCSCGKSDETAKYILLHYKNYTVPRNAILIGFREINNVLSIDKNTFLFGNEMQNDETHTHIVLLVQKFIQDTGRFTIN